LFLLCLGVSTVLEQPTLWLFRLSRCRFWNCQELIVSRIETLGHYSCLDFVFKLSRISWLSRCRFWNCEEFLDCQDVVFETVNIKNRSRIETLGRYYCRDFVFKTVGNFSTVKMLFLKLLRSRIEIEIVSRQIETPQA
jgi:hypothetical protein